MARDFGQGEAQIAVLRCLYDGNIRSLPEVAVAISAARRQVARAVNKLVAKAYVTRVTYGKYSITPLGANIIENGIAITSGPNGPVGPKTTVRNRADGFRDRAWRAMRIRRSFTVPDILMDATDGTEASPIDSAHFYIRSLKQGGYLRELPKRVPNAGRCPLKKWMLVRDTGPLAPAIQRNPRAVHDFNTGETVPCSQP